MLRQRGYGNFPGIFLTFSLVLLVLAMGFVLGRVVIGRMYIKTAPSFEPRVAEAPGGTEEQRPEEAPRPGRVYVPAPPERAPTGDVAPEETTPAGEGEPAEAPTEAPGQEATAPPPPPAPAPRPPAASEEPGGRRYSIQVGVFISETGARKAAEELTRTGYPARVELEREGGETRYRVLAGSYRTEATARRALEEIRQEGFQAFLVER